MPGMLCTRSVGDRADKVSAKEAGDQPKKPFRKHSDVGAAKCREDD